MTATRLWRRFPSWPVLPAAALPLARFSTKCFSRLRSWLNRFEVLPPVSLASRHFRVRSSRPEVRSGLVSLSLVGKLEPSAPLALPGPPPHVGAPTGENP